MSDTANELPEKLGRYEIVRQLGRGAMGIVYEGKDPNIGRRVAIKTARRDVMESSGRADEMMERFLREARAAGALNHPNIITIYDAGEQDGIAYIAMEYIEGTDLHKMMQDKHRFDVKDVADMGAIVCEALEHAHEKGIVHRDVKPSNIMILDDGSLRVADFGIARVSDSHLTQEGAMIGTPHYMSPEQFMGQKVDGRSDLFSVGIILYELLTGEKPFPGEALSTVMHSVIKTNPIDPKELNFSVNPLLSQVIMKSLAKDPNQRYQSGSEMAAALRECLKENPDPAIAQVPIPEGSLDKTVSMEAPEDDAERTQLAPSPESEKNAKPDSTVAGHPPFDEAVLSAETQVAASATEEKESAAAPARHFPLIPVAAGAAVVIVAAVVALMMLTGPEAHTYRLPIAVYVTKDPMVYLNAKTNLTHKDCEEAKSFSYRIVNPKNVDDPPLAKGTGTAGSVIVEFKTALPNIKIEVQADGYNSGEDNVGLRGIDLSKGNLVKIHEFILTTPEVAAKFDEKAASSE